MPSRRSTRRTSSCRSAPSTSSRRPSRPSRTCPRVLAWRDGSAHARGPVCARRAPPPRGASCISDRRVCARALHRALPTDLDKFTANLRLNNGRLSMYIKRWCNASSLLVQDAGIDDNSYLGNNVAYVCRGARGRRTGAVGARALRGHSAHPPPPRGGRASRGRGGTGCTLPQHSEPGDRHLRPERVVHGRDVHLRPQLLRRWLHLRAYAIYVHAKRCRAPHEPRARGSRGRSSPHAPRPTAPPPPAHGRAGVTCTGNVVPGYYFDASQVIAAGTSAVTTTCALGLAGNATRTCVWNGPTSPYGVWADPVSNCLRTCAPAGP